MIKIYNMDVMKALKQMPDESINCVMTSPPYFNQRDYGVNGQIGLEKTPEEYVKKLVQVFEEVKRVLRSDGSCWVNIGDCYGGFQGKNSGYPDSKTNASVPQIKRDSKTAKSLLCVPELFLLEMVKKGWLIRNKIIWYKRNVMPSSAKDRFTIDYEMIYFFVKNKQYFFNQQLEPVKTATIERNKYGHRGDGVTAIGRKRKPGEFATKVSKYQNLDEEKKHRQGMHKDRGDKLVEKRINLPKKKQVVDFLREWTNGFEKTLDKEFGEYKWRHWIRNDDSFLYPSKEDWITLKNMLDFQDIFDEQMIEIILKKDDVKAVEEFKRNMRTVWTINTKPFKGSHFAVFPKALIRTPIKAGCPEGGIVLDPFAGSGTTGLVAREQNKNSILIEINPKYVEIMKKRLMFDKKGNRNLYPEPGVIK